MLKNLARGLAIGVPAAALELLLLQWPGILQNNDQRSSPYPWEVFLAAGVTVAAVLSLAAARSRLPVLVGLGGTAMVVAGSGVGRQGVVQAIHPFSSPDPLLRVYTVQALNVRWPLIVAGAVVTAGALLWATLRSRHNLTFNSVFAPLVLVLMGAGTAAIALVTGTFVVTPVDFTGRPARRRDGASCEPPSLPATGSANGWLTAAHQEAESVVAFLELEGRLRSVGAPSELSTRCRSAAREEARHARLCCALARHSGVVAPTTIAHGQRPRSDWKPLRGLKRRSEVMRIALESLIDGSIGEGGSARRLELQSTSTDNAWAASTLAQMARDERGHARLGDDIVGWCRSEMRWSVGVGVRWATREYGRRVGADQGSPDLEIIVVGCKIHDHHESAHRDADNSF